MSLLRLANVLLKARHKDKVSFLGHSEITTRVYPNDLDINIHMNNARYASMMDIGRFDFLVTTGMMELIRHHGWRPVIGSSFITYLKPLKLFHKFQVHSKVIYWDEKWFYLEQKIMRGNEMMCYAYVKCLCIKDKKKITTQQLLKALGQDYAAVPAPSPALLKLIETEEHLKGQGRVFAKSA